MQQLAQDKRSVTRDLYDAVLFDLDGVITDTASVHAACWKRVFDEYLKERAQRQGDTFRPFDLTEDYRRYVDGKPRVDGVRDFLASRDIHLPKGSQNDPPDAETICGIGNRKNALVNAVIEGEGIEAYEGTISFIRQLRERGFKIAVVTSSHNCEAVLESAGLDRFFQVLVDGNVIDDQHLSGKPAPDSFLMAANLLGVPADRAVVVEDAISGVQAGVNGHFGLVVGVARHGNTKELEQNGANLVVQDLDELVN